MPVRPTRNDDIWAGPVGRGAGSYGEGFASYDVELTTNKCQGFLNSGGHVLTAPTQCRGAYSINVS